MDKLLSIDLGVKTGLSLFTKNGNLIWYRSQNFGNRSRLKKAIFFLLREIEDLKFIKEPNIEAREWWLKHLNNFDFLEDDFKPDYSILPDKNEDQYAHRGVA